MDHSTSAQPTKAASLDRLPDELKLIIITHLDIAPSVTKFNHEPSAWLTCPDEFCAPDSADTPLKRLSLTSRQWRNFVAPILFQYSRLEIEERDREWHLAEDFAGFLRLFDKYDMPPQIASLVVFTTTTAMITSTNGPIPRARTTNSTEEHTALNVWRELLKNVSPTRLVIAAPPEILAELLDTGPLSASAADWAFRMQLHYIELSHPKQPPFNQDNDGSLYTLREWTHMAYNEGSSIPVYSTYEFQDKVAPDVLNRFLFKGENQLKLESFTFIAVFPTHEQNFWEWFNKLYLYVIGNTLRRITVQLAPGPENDVLNSSGRLGKAQPMDLWFEWNQCYREIRRLMEENPIEGNLADGFEVVCLDCEVPELAAEIKETMGRLETRGVGWRESVPGTWVRDSSLDAFQSDDSEHSEDGVDYLSGSSWDNL